MAVERGVPDRSADGARSRIALVAAGGTVAAIVLLAGSLLWARGGAMLPQLRYGDAASDPAPPRVAPVERPRTARDDPRRLLGRFDPAPLDPLAPPSEAPLAFAEPLRLSAPYDVVDAMTFRTGGLTIRIAHIDGLRRGDVCYGEDGLKFACGLMGRAVLANLLRSHRVTCHPSTGQPQEEIVRADCFVGQTDLAEHQIRAGLAQPLVEASGRYREALLQAQESRTGAWNGGWSLMDLPEDKRNGS